MSSAKYGNKVKDSFLTASVFVPQGMEIVQTMNSDPGLAVGKMYFLSELNINH